MRRVRFNLVGALAPVLLSCGVAWAATISGVITNPQRCAGVSAIRRGGTVTRLRVKEIRGKFSPKTGKFVISRLKDGDYSLRVRLKGGGMIDGAPMKLDEEEESDRPLTDEDREAIKDFIVNYPVSFCDVFRPVSIQGNGEFARVIVEKIRHRDYHSGRKGDIVWRMEVWKFEKQTGAWVRCQHGWLVLARERVPRTMKHDTFKNLRWSFDPKAAGLAIVGGKSLANVNYTIPAKLGMNMGKEPGSVHKQIKADRAKRKKKAQEDGLELQ